MSAVIFRQVQPIIGTRDVERAIHFYVDRLGFTLKFKAGSRREPRMTKTSAR